MGASHSCTEQNVYGITYASFDAKGIRFESELAIHLADGTLTTLKRPTRPSERRAIEQLLRGSQAGRVPAGTPAGGSDRPTQELGLPPLDRAIADK